MRQFFFKAAILVTFSLCVMLTPTDAKSKTEASAKAAGPAQALELLSAVSDTKNVDCKEDQKDEKGNCKQKDEGKFCFYPAEFFGGIAAIVATFGTGGYKWWCTNTEIGRLYAAQQKARQKEEDKKGEQDEAITQAKVKLAAVSDDPVAKAAALKELQAAEAAEHPVLAANVQVSSC